MYESSPLKWRDTVLPETANAVVRMMVKTVEMGTSHRTFGTPERTPLLSDMDVAGKTGSLSGWTPTVHFEWFAGVAPVGSPRLALAALVVNDGRWKIKGSYVGKEAFNTYFGYPSSMPPVLREGAREPEVDPDAPHGREGGADGQGEVEEGQEGDRRPENAAPRRPRRRASGSLSAGNSSAARAGG